jgi:hypothetical protein
VSKSAYIAVKYRGCGFTKAIALENAKSERKKKQPFIIQFTGRYRGFVPYLCRNFVCQVAGISYTVDDSWTTQ